MNEDQARLRIRTGSEGLRKWAGGLEIAAALGAIGGVVGAFLLIIAKQTDASGTATHPYIDLGIGLAGGAVFWGVFEWCVARALLLFAESTALSHGVALDAPEHASDSSGADTVDLIDIMAVAELLGSPGDRKNADRAMRGQGAPRVEYDGFGRTRWPRAEVEAWIASLGKE